MKSKILKIAAAGLILLFAEVSIAGMVRSENKVDLSTAIEESAKETEQVAQEFRAKADRAPESMGESTYVEYKKSKFEDLVPSMDEFNLMQEQMMQETNGVAAQ